MAKIFLFKCDKKIGQGDMKKVSVFDVTNYYLARADEEEISMTHLKLQKIWGIRILWWKVNSGYPEMLIYVSEHFE